MATFFVNGRSVTATKSQSLLRFLRDELRLTSVKDGCSEGACGACTVIIDGETCRACVPKTDQLEGSILRITVDGPYPEEVLLTIDPESMKVIDCMMLRSEGDDIP